MSHAYSITLAEPVHSTASPCVLVPYRLLPSRCTA